VILNERKESRPSINDISDDELRKNMFKRIAGGKYIDISVSTPHSSSRKNS